MAFHLCDKILFTRFPIRRCERKQFRGIARIMQYQLHRFYVGTEHHTRVVFVFIVSQRRVAGIIAADGDL